MTDIRLEQSNVVVEGTLQVRGPDIKLYRDDRKNPSNRAFHRRAIVHGHEDQLILNYANDYFGIQINGAHGDGIKLNGIVSINGTNILEIMNGLQETVGKLMENQDALAERIHDLEIKAGIRPSRIVEDFAKKNKKLLRQSHIRIPIK